MRHGPAFRIRDAGPADIPAIARLHLNTWNETYPEVRDPPTEALRSAQWRQAFASSDPDWFCLLVETDSGELVGFAKAVRYTEAEPPGFSGELNKLYVRRRYHGLGLGRRLLEEVARRFLACGITSMLLFSEPSNPSGGFFETMGGRRLHAADGEFHGAYGWDDLRNLLCD